MNNRLTLLQGFLEKDPSDSFSRYALALEHLKHGDVSEGIREFETLLQRDPNYAATYYHLGKTYEKAGRADDAKSLYQQGIALTAKSGDAHANKELKEALFMLTGGDDDED